MLRPAAKPAVYALLPKPVHCAGTSLACAGMLQSMTPTVNTPRCCDEPFITMLPFPATRYGLSGARSGETASRLRYTNSTPRFQPAYSMKSPKKASEVLTRVDPSAIPPQSGTTVCVGLSVARNPGAGTGLHARDPQDGRHSARETRSASHLAELRPRWAVSGKKPLREPTKRINMTDGQGIPRGHSVNGHSGAQGEREGTKTQRHR